uniref:Uncharacterized protein n=1 Tax=Arundo donax TaxID=35708 RepID=A0A0A9HPR3_ARUDO
MQASLCLYNLEVTGNITLFGVSCGLMLMICWKT